MNDRPTADEIENVVDESAHDGWRTVNWEESNGADQPARITLELEYVPPEDRLGHPQRQIKDAIDHIGDDEGAPIDEVILYVADKHDTPSDTVSKEIENLRTRGEIYEPRQGTLRTT